MSENENSDAEWLAAILKEIQDASTEELESIADDYNWDDGFQAPTAIIRSIKCDLGTALKLYWHGGAQWLTQYANASEVPPLDSEGWEFCAEVEERVKNNFYKNKNIVYDGRCDAADYPENPQRRDIPEIMFQPFSAPVPFSMQLLHDAIQASMEFPEKQRISHAMSYIKERVKAGADLKEIHSLVTQHLKNQSSG